ncbi:L-alanine exporter AlaE [Sulfitobacter porphyrae]|uniref:L-alanine exporter AlaE n=1 Tax=Sulfitobacter porphyrae TaxID=1246864 RepID=A0ABW2BB55_9RHOB|nr:hypothetical protein GCM10007928_48910 [Sulfitobacter porphyrae]
MNIFHLPTARFDVFVDVGDFRHCVPRNGHGYADTFAVVTFYTFVGGLNEFFVAGLTANELLWARLAAIPILIATGAIYGVWRDIVRAATLFESRSQAVKTLIEIGLCLVFRVPVYALILECGGAEGDVFWRGMAGGVLVILFSARPCGMWIEYVRRTIFRLRQWLEDPGRNARTSSNCDHS